MAAPTPPGLLVITHGGSPGIREAVRATLAPLEARYPMAVAFGTAHPVTIRRGLERLAGKGVERVAVVRLMMDGDSFRHQTDFFLGLRTDPPSRFVMHGADLDDGAAAADASAAEHDRPIDHGMSVAHGTHGLLDAPPVAAILLERARSASTDPASESVLVLAHGVEDAGRNERWIAAMDRQCTALRAVGFHRVRPDTLREDWPSKRAEAETSIRAFVRRESSAGRRVLVVPFRLYGFEPYHDVLSGLTYRAVEQGLLPHRRITAWVDAQVRALFPDRIRSAQAR